LDRSNRRGKRNPKGKQNGKIDLNPLNPPGVGNANADRLNDDFRQNAMISSLFAMLFFGKKGRVDGKVD
jgi:hypothetical protein